VIAVPQAAACGDAAKRSLPIRSTENRDEKSKTQDRRIYLVIERGKDQ